MPEQEPNPLTLKSAKYFFHEGRLQIELSDARILRIAGLPRFNLPAEGLQPPTITTARVVEKLVETDKPQDSTEAQEKEPVHTFTGKIKGVVREGRPDRSGNKTAWARFAIHEENSDKAKMLSATFHRHTANKALTLPADAQITASGYLRPTVPADRMDTYHIFNLVNYPGKQPATNEPA